MSTLPLDEAYVQPNKGFAELYRAEYPGLVAVAAALVQRQSDAEDLVQDTMVRAFLHWERVRRYERPGGWCHRVLLNVCRNWWRRHRREVAWSRIGDRSRAGRDRPDGRDPVLTAALALS